LYVFFGCCNRCPCSQMPALAPAAALSWAGSWAGCKLCCRSHPLRQPHAVRALMGLHVLLRWPPPLNGPALPAPLFQVMSSHPALRPGKPLASLCQYRRDSGSRQVTSCEQSPRPCAPATALTAGPSTSRSRVPSQWGRRGCVL
jgi:hypothetical protein